MTDITIEPDIDHLCIWIAIIGLFILLLLSWSW